MRITGSTRDGIREGQDRDQQGVTGFTDSGTREIKKTERPTTAGASD
jgi:hypothetical protein